MSDVKKQGTRVVGFYNTKSGGFKSLTIDAKCLEALQNLDEGGQFWFYENTKKEKETQPDFNLVFYTASEVAERRAAWEARKGGSTGKPSPTSRPVKRVPTRQSDDDLSF